MNSLLPLLLASTLLAAPLRFLHSQDVTRLSSGTRASAPTILKVLTWNIWMMPEILPGVLGGSPSNRRRAQAIAAVLNEQHVDVICLEKAFDKKARKIIAHWLYANYPYTYGPANNGGFSLRINSGVWVLSRIPLEHYRQIEFSKAANFSEWLARKGAISLTGTIGDRPFLLLATHLQGEETPYYTESHQKVRDIQVGEIERKLLTPPPPAGTPVFIAGDFVTPRYESGPTSPEAQAYLRTIATLQAVNGPGYRITLDDDRNVNTLAESNTGRTDELDYVFLRANDALVSGAWERRVFRRRGWDCRWNRADLSYRYAVVATFSMP
jgi:endonuclease/exonuclease/phosphatase family metal-dependent hydrolase